MRTLGIWKQANGELESYDRETNGVVMNLSRTLGKRGATAKNAIERARRAGINANDARISLFICLERGYLKLGKGMRLEWDTSNDFVGGH